MDEIGTTPGTIRQVMWIRIRLIQTIMNGMPMALNEGLDSFPSEGSVRTAQHVVLLRGIMIKANVKFHIIDQKRFKIVPKTTFLSINDKKKTLSISFGLRMTIIEKQYYIVVESLFKIENIRKSKY